MKAYVRAHGENFVVDGLDNTVWLRSTVHMLVPLPMDGDRVQLREGKLQIGEWVFDEASGDWVDVEEADDPVVSWAAREVELLREQVKELSQLISNLRWWNTIAWTLVVVLVVAVVASLSN